MRRRSTLRDISERVDYGLATSAVIGGEGPRFLRITDIENSFVDWRSVPRCEASSSEVAKYELRTGDIVVARTGASTGRSQWVEVDELAIFASYLVRFRVKSDICSRFIGYVLDSDPWRGFIASVAHGKSAQPNISASEMARFEFECPPLEEQQAIAEVLGALDDKIVANAGLSSTLSRLAILLLADQPPTVPLSRVVEHRKRSLNPLNFVGDQVAHFSIPAFDAGCRPELAAPSAIKSSKFAIDQPSVLVSKLNPRFPRLWEVQKLPDRFAVASTEFLVLESKYSTSSVLWAILSQPPFSISLEAKVSGTSGSHQRVRPDDLLATRVIDPRELSTELQDQLTSLGQCIALRNDESATLAATRDALLPQLMSGKIRVKDARKTVGEVL